MEPGAAQGADQGVDGIEVRRGHVGAVEGDCDGGGRGCAHVPPPHPSPQGGGGRVRAGIARLDWGPTRADPVVRIVPAAIGHLFRAAHGPRIQPRRQRKLGKCCLGGDGTACVTQGGQTAQGADGQGGQIVECWIGPPVGGQHGKGDALAAAQVLHRGEAVGPVSRPADHADQDAACAGQGVFDIGIDG